MAKKTTKKKTTAKGRTTKAKQQAQKQMWAVGMFALGVLLGCLTFIKGDGFWNNLHLFVFGMLGWTAYCLGPVCIYLAILATMDRPMEFVKRKLWQASVLLLLISGAIEVFGGLPKVEGLARIIVALYKDGMANEGGGVLGILTAGPLSLIGSSPIPQIIIVILLFLFFMLVTGSTLMNLYKGIKKPVESFEAVFVDHLENRQQLEEEREKQKADGIEPPAGKFRWGFKKEEPKKSTKFDIDVDISDDKTPEELEMQVPMETIIDDLKDVDLNAIKAENAFRPPVGAVGGKWGGEIDPDPVPEKSILDGWGTDSPVEYLSGFHFEESKVEEERPHPLEADIAEAEEEDVLRVVQEYLKSIKTNDDPLPVASTEPKEENESPIEIETFKADFSLPVTPPLSAEEVAFAPPITSMPPVNPWMSPSGGMTSAIKGDAFVPKIVPPSARVEAPSPQPIKPAGKTASTVSSAEESAIFSDDGYRLPPLTLLEKPSPSKAGDFSAELKENAQRLVETLESFGVKTKIIDVTRGPSVTRYELQPSPGVKISRITGLADDIALNLAAAGIRIEAPIPNKAAVGIEVPNKNISIVRFKEIVDSKTFKDSTADVAMALGKDITGNITVADISKMPHMLIAGATGSGKSVCINSIIMSILYKYSPDEVKLLMIDPKVVELGVYNGIPHLLVPVVTDAKKASGALSWAVAEMLKRYKTFAESGVRDIRGYNRFAETDDAFTIMPKIVIIIDELADLMMAAPAEVEDSICRLAQMARAAGMHLVIATQRPSVDVITGIIKANVPSRIAFAVSSQVDSRTILDSGGAEKLLGRGDMLFYPVGAAKPIRVQGCFVTDQEVEKVVDYVKSNDKANYDEHIVEEIERLAVAEQSSLGGGGGFDDEDEMVPFAIECVVEAGQASTSLLQRRLKLGYARAARIIDQLEARGIIGPFEGSKPRQLLISKDQYIEMKLAGQDQAGSASDRSSQL